MKELICFCLLICFAAVFPLCWATIGNNEMYVKSAAASLLVGMVLSTILNLLIKNIGFYFSAKLPKKFKGKLTPVYRIEKEYWSIEKWELQSSVIQNSFGTYVTLPFIALFREWKYVNTRTVISNTPPDQIENLADMFEFLATEEDFKKLKELEEQERKDAPYKRLNKDFLENYTT